MTNGEIGKSMRFSVIIPAFNAARTIGRTLRSVFAQTDGDWEIIVVNDGSTDATESVVAKLAESEPRVSLIDIGHGGVSAARNSGLKAASGAWALFLDADDWVSPFYLERARERFARDPSLDAVYCRWGYVTGTDEVAEIVDQPAEGPLFPVFAQTNPFLIHSCIVTTRLARSVGGFDEAMSHGEDGDFWQRIARTGARFGFLGDVLAFYGIRADSAAIDALASMAASLAVMRRGSAPDLRTPASVAYADGIPRDRLFPVQLINLLAWFAGIAIGQGLDPRELIKLAEKEVHPDDRALFHRYDATGVCRAFVAGLTRSLAVPITQYPSVRKSHADAASGFFTALEWELGVPGFTGTIEEGLLRQSLEIGFRAGSLGLQKTMRQYPTFEFAFDDAKGAFAARAGRRQDIWGVTTLFGASRSVRMRANYRRFRARLRQQGLRLATVELAFGDDPFVLDETDAEKLMQLRTGSVFWHKERLLNVAIQQLPSECRKVVWLDADVLFENDAWLSQAADALEEYPVLQPFSYSVRLPPDAAYFNPDRSYYPRNVEDGDRLHSFGLGWRHFGTFAQQACELHGHPGYAWAARREIVGKHGLYDTSIVSGAGDILTAEAFIGYHVYLSQFARRHSTRQLARYVDWADAVYEDVRGRIGYVPGMLFHLWNGYHNEVQYGHRCMLETQFNFDPRTDIALDAAGLYRWTTGKQGLVDAVARFFAYRNDDKAPKRTAFRPISGVYDNEGGYCWCSREAAIEVVRSTRLATFTLASNVLENTGISQTIVVTLNGLQFTEITLRDNTPKAICIPDAEAGDRLSFASDFEFRPSDRAGTDNRRLSFMLRT